MANMMVSEDLFGFDLSESDNVYSTSVNRPQYLPREECPQLYSLYNDEKYKKLVSDIENSDLDTETKDFLKLAATRHIVFNYDKIADYYAHMPAETQRFFEQSALVIIDFEDAIANGYVRLNNRLRQIEYNNSKGTEKEE